MLGGSFSVRGWWHTKTGCPRRLWKPHPWRHSRQGWMWLWAAWSGGWQLPMAEGLKLDDLWGPFQPRPFYDSMAWHRCEDVCIWLACVTKYWKSILTKWWVEDTVDRDLPWLRFCTWRKNCGFPWICRGPYLTRVLQLCLTSSTTSGVKDCCQRTLDLEIVIHTSFVHSCLHVVWPQKCDDQGAEPVLGNAWEWTNKERKLRRTEILFWGVCIGKHASESVSQNMVATKLEREELEEWIVRWIRNWLHACI